MASYGDPNPIPLVGNWLRGDIQLNLGKTNKQTNLWGKFTFLALDNALYTSIPELQP